MIPKTVIAFLCLLVLGSLVIQAASKTPDPLPEPLPVVPEPPKKISIVAVGDIMAHMSLINAARQKDKSYDFSPAFKDISPYLSGADIAIGNLETLFVAGKAPSGYPRFNAPPALARDLKKAGFDVLTTANNHSLDYSAKGVVDTIQALDKHGLLHAGTADTATKNSFALVEKNGVRIAVMAYTCSTNGLKLPKGKDYLLNRYSKELVAREVAQAQGMNADLMVGYVHFGDEYDRFPSREQYRIVSEMEQAGFQIILGSHPHVLQPEINRINKDRYVIFSLGNFISGQRARFTDVGMILKFDIEKNLASNKTSILKVAHIPTVTRNVKGTVSVLTLESLDEKMTSLYAKKLTYNRESLYKDTLGHVKGGVYLD